MVESTSVGERERYLSHIGTAIRIRKIPESKQHSHRAI
jgi:hypothetical protein